MSTEYRRWTLNCVLANCGSRKLSPAISVLVQATDSKSIANTDIFNIQIPLYITSKVIPMHVMKSYGGMAAYLHLLLTSALYGLIGGLTLGHCTSGEEAHGTHFVGG